MNEIKAILEEISVEQIESHIRNLEGIRHPVIAPDALERAADYIWNHLESWGHEMRAHRFSEDGQEFRNIIGTYRGTQQPEQKIVVLAHYDTVSTSPGANDNASGVAAMLELARVLRKLRFQKSILFIGVNLEERKIEGDRSTPFLRGSTALAAYAKEQGWKIEGVVNFEEIAFAGETVRQTTPKNIPLEMPEAGNFIAVVGNEKSTALVESYIQAIDQYQIPLPYLPLIVPGNGEMIPDTRRSDHASFWDHSYPAIMLTDTANFRTPHYHKPSDTSETLNIAFATEVCRAGGGLVINMSGVEAR